MFVCCILFYISIFLLCFIFNINYVLFFFYNMYLEKLFGHFSSVTSSISKRAHAPCSYTYITGYFSWFFFNVFFFFVIHSFAPPFVMIFIYSFSYVNTRNHNYYTYSELFIFSCSMWYMCIYRPRYRCHINT